MKKYKAVIFDMDGTVVDSALDFKQMRKDLNLSENTPILEFLKPLHGTKKFDEAMIIINNHERIGAESSVILRDFKTFYKTLKNKEIPLFIHTRNSREVTDYTLSSHQLKFSKVISRDDAYPKPSPEGVDMILNEFKLVKEDVLFIGDTIHDLETAVNANIDFALIRWPGNDYLIDKSTISFDQYSEILKYFTV